MFTSKTLVNIHSDFRALGFLTGDDVMGDIGLMLVNTLWVETIAYSRIYLNFFWSSHLPACLYYFFMFSRNLCSYIVLLLKDGSTPMVCTWSFIPGDWMGAYADALPISVFPSRLVTIHFHLQTIIINWRWHNLWIMHNPFIKIILYLFIDFSVPFSIFFEFPWCIFIFNCLALRFSSSNLTISSFFHF